MFILILVNLLIQLYGTNLILMGCILSYLSLCATSYYVMVTGETKAATENAALENQIKSNLLKHAEGPKMVTNTATV